MRLRSHLLWLTLATLMPMVVFGVSATAIIAGRERGVFQRGAQERTLALLTAVDTELTGHLNTLRGLAGSEAIESDDLPVFHAQATRMLRTQPNWRSISLADAHGKRLLATGHAVHELMPPIRDRLSFEDAVLTGRPTIGNLVQDEGAYRIPVRLPILRDGRVVYVLNVLVDPAAVLALLSPQQLETNWVAVVLDANRRIVARTVDHASLVGQPASESLRAALDRGSEGWFHGRTVEGTEVYAPFSRSAVTSWTVAMGIPASTVEATATRAIWMLAAGTLAAMSVALVLARTLAHRISAPIVSLASAATDLGRGRAIAPPPPGGVTEVNDVQSALVTAARVIGDRETALKAAHRAKDEFLAMLSHELRNPLGAMASAAALLRVSPPAEPHAKAAVAAIGRQIEHMTRLVDDLLDVSRATSGKIHLNLQPRELSAIVAGAVRAMRASGRLDEREVTVEAEPVWAETDETRLDQIVVNLVGNAVKYTGPGDRIAIRVVPSNGEAVLEVEDSGIGIAPDLLPRIFDVFVQGDRSLDRRAGGLGLGLTLVKRLAELHGGRVGAHSAGLGRGARFTVVLPAIAEPAGAARAETPVAATARRCRILLIEDHDDAREMMRTGLELQGQLVFEAADGPQGLRMAAEVAPDAIVVDLGLPGLDGYEVARRLRQRPELAGTLIVALSGYGLPEARQRSREAGFDVHLTKPVSPDDLGALIAARLDAAQRSA